MFGTGGKKRVRGSDAQVGVMNVRDASFWTTVVVPSECYRDLQGFGYSVGGQFPVQGRYIPATKADTNLRQQNQIPFDLFKGTQFEWHVPAVAPGRFQPSPYGIIDQKDYAVQPSDVGAFAAAALIRFYVGGLIVVDHKPSLDQVSKVLMDDALQFHQIVQRLAEGKELQLREFQCIRASIEFPGGGPKFGDGASIPVVLAWRGTAATKV